MGSFAVRHADLLPLLSVLDAEARVGPGRDGAQLALQLAVARQPVAVEGAGCDRGLDRAAGLGVVGAVGETAPQRQLLDVFEDAGERIFTFPELRLAQPRRVD